MQPITFLILTVLLACAVYCDDSGQYSKSKYNNEGNYVNDVGRWAYHHVDDQRDLGKYHHVNIPYDGGYGPYDHIPNPYNHQDSKYVDEFGQIPYVPFHDKYGYTPFKDQHGYTPFNDKYPYKPFNDKYPYAQGGSSDLGVSIDPFMNKFFNDPTPEFLALYGVPDQGRQINTIKKIFKRNVENLNSQKEAAARKRYDDEGRWKIIKQEGKMNEEKYNFLYETENGITASEQAKTKSDGTSGSGFYEYTGDDDKVYRVEYQADENGFIPQGEHIHPEIRKHLDNIKNKKYD